VTRGQVFALVVGEACVVAFVAACLGLGLGRLLAEGLIGLVSQTINDHYVAVTVRAVHTSPRVVVEAFVLGLGAAVVAAAVPAWEATRVTPRAALSASDEQRGARRAMPRAGALGLMLLAMAGALLALPTTSVGVGFAALFAVVSGAALLAPAATALGIRALSPAGARLGGVAGSVAMRGVAAGLGRTAVAVAALMVALSATVGVGVMVDSFRGSVADWLGTTLRADLYVGVEGPSGFVRLPPGLAGQIAGIPGVGEVSQGRRFRAESTAGPVRALALRMARESYQGFDLVAGNPDRAWRAFDRDGAVLVSEPLAWRRGLGPGSGITLRTDRGPTAFAVAGVYRDYRSDQGGVLMSRDTYRRFWDDDAVTGLGVYLAPGTDARRVRAAVADLLPGDGSLRVRSNAGIREASLEVFDRTFTVTRVLRWLAVIVAFVGILSALMALALERAREVAVLRSLGFTRGQVWGLVQLQTGVLGLLAGLFAIPLGLLLAVLLVQVINRRSFGWTMALDVDPSLLAQAPALALAAALLAGLYPAWRMATTPPATALRSD
jgi:putative ABC transport system permease protein